MHLPFTLNPVLEHLPVYQPGRPIAEVARELGLPEGQIIKLASNENPLGPAPAALAAMRRALRQLHLYPDGNAFILSKNWRPNSAWNQGISFWAMAPMILSSFWATP